MTKLLHIIKDRILTHGPLSLSEYIELALHHPDYGYYRIQNPLGVSGDFTTSPEISPLFGDCVGEWVWTTWRQSNTPRPLTLIEWGPGRGLLIERILAAAPAPLWPELSVILVESNASLRNVQQTRLAPFISQGLTITWVEDIHFSLPQNFSISIANEFWDALPLHQFFFQDEGWQEKTVDWDVAKNALVFSSRPAQPPRDNLYSGEFCEFSPQGFELFQRLTHHLAEWGGGLLLIDYGANTLQCQDTFQAVQHHQITSPLESPGEVDLSAHVNFAHLLLALQERASQFETAFSTQSAFLEKMGLLRLAEHQVSTSPPGMQRMNIANAVHRLTSDRYMGTLFKVLEVTTKTPQSF